MVHTPKFPDKRSVFGYPPPYYGHENEMYNVGVSLKEVECL